MHRMRNLQVRDMIKFYRENNHLYADVVPNESMLNPEFLNNDVDHSFLETVEDNTGEFEQGMNKEQQNVCGGTNASSVMNKKDEPYVMERQMGISECSAPAMAQKHPETTNSEDQCERHFERSTEKFPYPYLNVWQTTQC
ncbi:hypothetical protein PC116_g21722 [Phytophthora cactorum]|uniref:Uncharacterized protein n=1 Tax=Phytophthora cactorum TaxID=29920 RepID=A0A8T1K0K3_9STRA|nr:hypothetical protein PC111_g22743 [Phytophthora cactorum]KAG2818157.1 hypothetical protein PC113_g22890 [Phytophthora cactorum]KAG2964442.1 hypothetical protein PC119_g25247 [Phytophthora cactorum]KAG3127931.1 hypothetical protein C6341_g24778 [Phytophthora cactorum]KAG4229967.1 hypothetical protein PC116_g21722 [Phytophthora cactorum]